ncbi:hypothetical protein V1264_011128 [Littorina saxatilis]
MWDDSLARDAEEWSKYCRYSRPPKHMFQWGSNLFYNRKHVRSWHSIRANVRRGLQAWSRERSYFRYGTDCGVACSYAQMVYSSTYRVGCAMNKCGSIKTANGMERHATLFICFYAPRGRLVGTYPYRSGSTCSQCPAGTRCSEGLCADSGSLTTSSRRPETIRRITGITRTSPVVPSPTAPGGRLPMSADGLTSSEENYMLQLQNNYRRDDGCQNLRWDNKLQQWTDWIINCKTDYPGPPHAYTNFYRCPDHMPVYEAVREWAKEGRETHIQMESGCRTPYDRTQCNHFTNMVQPRVTSMACSACNCGDGTRQVVCVYDNQVERQFRGYK